MTDIILLLGPDAVRGGRCVLGDALAGGELPDYVGLRHCSDDRVEIWHGSEAPIHACGAHEHYSLQDVYAAHKLLHPDVPA